MAAQSHRPQNIVQLLLKISDSLTRIESLLHIVPNEESDSPENSASSMPSYLRPEQEGTEDKSVYSCKY